MQFKVFYFAEKFLPRKITDDVFVLLGLKFWFAF
jgi:hypothetical protein